MFCTFALVLYYYYYHFNYHYSLSRHFFLLQFLLSYYYSSSSSQPFTCYLSLSCFSLYPASFLTGFPPFCLFLLCYLRSLSLYGDRLLLGHHYNSFTTFLANINFRGTIKQLIDFDSIPWRKNTYTPPTRLHKLALKQGHASGLTCTCPSCCSYKYKYKASSYKYSTRLACTSTSTRLARTSTSTRLARTSTSTRLARTSTSTSLARTSTSTRLARTSTRLAFFSSCG